MSLKPKGRIFNLIGIGFIIILLFFIILSILGFNLGPDNSVIFLLSLIIFIASLALPMFVGFIGYKKGDKRLGIIVSTIGGIIIISFIFLFNFFTIPLSFLVIVIFSYIAWKEDITKWKIVAFIVLTATLILFFSPKSIVIDIGNEYSNIVCGCFGIVSDGNYCYGIPNNCHEKFYPPPPWDIQRKLIQIDSAVGGKDSLIIIKNIGNINIKPENEINIYIDRVYQNNVSWDKNIISPTNMSIATVKGVNCSGLKVKVTSPANTDEVIC